MRRPPKAPDDSAPAAPAAPDHARSAAAIQARRLDAVESFVKSRPATNR